MKAHDAVEMKGRDAFAAGLPRSSCPYIDHRTIRGNVTGARGYIHAWLRGWDAAEKDAGDSPR